jgi:hypothetical protein
MKGVRFYEEFANKRRGVSEGNVVAILFCNGFTIREDGRQYDAIVALTHDPNSTTASSGVSSGYLRKKCKRITEARAREIHPKLFTILDSEP